VCQGVPSAFSAGREVPFGHGGLREIVDRWPSSRPSVAATGEWPALMAWRMLKEIAGVALVTVTSGEHAEPVSGEGPG
jgi:hypothetical protein